MKFEIKKIRKDFPFFKHNKGLVYFDSAATSLTPGCVIDSQIEFYKKYKSNVHRGVYKISALATEKYDQAHDIVADFINADKSEIVFNSGATQGLNNLAYGLEEYLKPGDSIVLTRLEHHSNLIPWQELAKRSGAVLRFIELTPDCQIDEASIYRAIDESTKIVAVTHVSNTLGTIVPVEQICNRAKAVGAFSIIDASQSAPHLKINVKEIGCDFLVFSGHKMLGPTGIGVLFGRKEFLEKLNPVTFGGGMISSVSYEKAEWGSIPQRFEAGTPNISGAIGLAKAIEYISCLGQNNILKAEDSLTKYALEQLQTIPGLKIIGPNKNRIGVISFIMAGLHPFDIGTLLDEQNIAVRTGHHCTQPLLEKLGLDSTVRISLSLYNTEKEIDLLISALNKIIKVVKS